MSDHTAAAECCDTVTLVDENGRAWTAARWCAETIIAATLVGMPWLIWDIFA